MSSIALLVRQTLQQQVLQFHIHLLRLELGVLTIYLITVLPVLDIQLLILIAMSLSLLGSAVYPPQLIHGQHQA